MSCDAGEILQGRRELEPALRTVLTAALRRLREEGKGTDLAVEVIIQSQMSVLVGSMNQLLASGPARLRAAEAMLDVMARGLGLPREAIRDGEMMR